MKQEKRMPRFKTAEQEAEFWETHSAVDYRLISADPTEVLADLKRQHQKKKNVTLRLEPELMRRLKGRAKKVGVRTQTFVREWLWRAVV